MHRPGAFKAGMCSAGLAQQQVLAISQKLIFYQQNSTVQMTFRDENTPFVVT